ncbi:MAG: YihY/virulence factor BrkB family protein [Solirubrobacterales bacterium]
MEAAGGGERGSALERLRARAGHALGRAAKLAERSIDAFFKHRCPQLAASISYYALLSVFPAAIVMAVVFGLIISGDDARREVVDFLFDNLPVSEEEGRRDLEDAVDGVTRNPGTLGLIGGAALLYSASALMGAVRNSLTVVWGSERDRPPLRGKALDILLVLGLGLLIGLSLAVTIARRFAVDLSEDLGALGRALESALDASGFLIPLGLSVVTFAVVYRVLPHPRPRLRDVWPGIVLATVGYELAKRGFALYLENFGNYSAVYGSLGAVITFLVFIYIAAMVFLMGAEFAALWPRVRRGEFDDGGEGKPLAEEIRGFLRGLVLERRERDPERSRPGD